MPLALLSFLKSRHLEGSGLAGRGNLVVDELACAVNRISKADEKSSRRKVQMLYFSLCTMKG